MVMDVYSITRLLVVLSLLSLITCKVITGTKYNYLQHVIKSLGSNHLSGVFPSEVFLQHAIEHTKSLLPSTTNTLDKAHYVTCTDYSRIHVAAEFFRVQAIQYTLSYSSAHDGLACFYLFATVRDVDKINHSSIQFSMLEPVPAIVKMDRSVHDLQHVLFSSVSSMDSSNSRSYHPIITDARNGEKLTLSIMLKSDVTFSAQALKWENWMKAMKDSKICSLDGTSQSIFWMNYTAAAVKGPKIGTKQTLSGKSHHLDLLSIDRNSRQHVQMPVFQRSNEVRGMQPWKTFGDRHKAWTEWSTVMKKMKSLNLHKDLCGLSSLQVEHRRNNVIVLLPPELLRFSDSTSDTLFVLNNDVQYMGSAISGACFAELLSLLLSDAAVTRVAVSRPIRTLNNLARQITQSGSLSGSSSPILSTLNGSGVIIGVSDTGIDENSCYFRDMVHGKVPRAGYEDTVFDLKYRKVIQYVNFSGSGGDYASGHGSHVSGTLAGYCQYESNNDANNQYKGIASAAKLAFFDIGIDSDKQTLTIPTDLGVGIFGSAYKAGARIHSNSWGGGYAFDSTCIDTDKYMYENQDFLILFAAGNSGSSGIETILSPSNSKNAITVACSNTGHSTYQNIDKITGFSSQGPTLDGRMKPDISAPGNYIISAKANSEHSDDTTCATTIKQGTSMATPVTAGNAALLYQYFIDDQFWAASCNPKHLFCKPFAPSASLLKALLLQSGKALTGYDGDSAVHLTDPPDIYQGYGRVNLDSILNSHLFVDQSYLTELTKNTYSIRLNSSDVQLKVTLCWMDPPNEAFSAKYLLHDLDLVVTDPTGNTFYGNSFNNDGQPAMGSHRDEVNNNEQVSIKQPVVGEWLVEVQSKRLTEALAQNYSIVITADGEVAAASSLVAISPALLEMCSVGSGGDRPSPSPRLEVEVAKWSRVAITGGWATGDYYSIDTDEGSNSYHQNSSFNENFLLEIDKQCLPAGCYYSSLHLSVTNDMAGRQVSIPQCGVYLAPMSPVASFCIEEPTLVSNADFSSDPSSDTVSIFAENSCYSTCEMSDHIYLPLLLTEHLNGAGWSGHYYAIIKIPEDNFYDNALNSFSLNSLGAMNMEWGFEHVENQCLPAVDDCYVMQFSISTAIKDSSNDDVEDPEIYFFNSVLEQQSLCGSKLNVDTTLAKICVSSSAYSQDNHHQDDDIIFNVDIQLFNQESHNVGFGQFASIFWDDFIQSFNDLNFVGNCSIKVPLKQSSYINASSSSSSSDYIIIPSLSPTISPIIAEPPIVPSIASSLIPTTTTYESSTLSPSQSPSPTSSSKLFFGDYDYDCLKKCSGFPDDYLFTSDTNKQRCYFLLDVYHLCSSFNVAMGLCPRPICASTCSIDNWCYFGAGTVLSCPDLPWQGNTMDAMNITHDCVDATRALSNDDDNANNDNKAHFSKSVLAICLGLISILLVGTVIYTVRKKFQTNNDFARLESSSTHSENDGSVNDDDEMIKTKNVAIYQNTASTTDGDGNGTGTVKDSIKKFFKKNLVQKVTQYSVVKSPFSIVGDEEEEDDDHDHDDHDHGDVEINQYHSNTSIIGKYGDDLDTYDGEYSQEADGKDVGSDDGDDEDDDDVSDEFEAKL